MKVSGIKYMGDEYFGKDVAITVWFINDKNEILETVIEIDGFNKEKMSQAATACLDMARDTKEVVIKSLKIRHQSK